MNEDICLHAIYARDESYNRRQTKKTLELIFDSGALLSLEKQGVNRQGYFNGNQYISLCDYALRNEMLNTSAKHNAYSGYICYSLSIVFPKEDLSIIRPHIIDIPLNTFNDYQVMMDYGMKTERYSNLPDEIQVKDMIPISKMIGITLPLKRMTPIFNRSEKNITKIILKEVESINELMNKYHYQVPIYDIHTFTKLDNEENIKKLVRKLK